MIGGEHLKHYLKNQLNRFLPAHCGRFFCVASRLVKPVIACWLVLKVVSQWLCLLVGECVVIYRLAIFTAIPAKGEAFYVPETNGNNEPGPLWTKFEDHPDYWSAAEQFLGQF